MSQKRTLVRGATKNCRAQDPSTCRYHGEAFQPITKASEFTTQIFEQVNKDLSPSRVIPAGDDTGDEELLTRFSYEQDSLSLDERRALHSFTDQYGSQYIRAVLSNPDGKFEFNGDSTEAIRSRVEVLDGLLSKHSIDVATKELWRGVKEFKYELSDIKEGSVFTNLSYTSTTSNPEVAVSFSSKESPILLKVRAGVGYPVGGQFRAEQETLLRRGMSFRVMSIQENVHLEKKHPRFGEDSRIRGITLVEIEEVK